MKTLYKVLIALALLFVSVHMAFAAGVATITPATPLETQNLVCDVTQSNAIYEYYWYESGVMRKHQRSTSSTLEHGYTTGGETWTCKAFVPSSAHFPETFHSQDTALILDDPNANQCPEFASSFSTYNVQEGNQLQFVHPVATDADGDPLTYSVHIVPMGASYNAAQRRFTWTPSFTQSGMYNVEFHTSDGVCEDHHNAQINVGNTNRAPLLHFIADQSVNENNLLTFTVSGSDPDGDALTFSATNLPSGASFDASARMFSWTPNSMQQGTYDVTFRVQDLFGLYDDQIVRITVTNVNNAPILAPIGNKVVAELSLLQFTISATDADNDPLAFSAIDLPAGASFNPGTRIFSWIPTSTQSGTYPVTLRVSDPHGAADQETILITVTDVFVPQCSDGQDNDGDSLIDFPNDPGCSHPSDNDETNVFNAAPAAIIDTPNSDLTIVRGSQVSFTGTGIDSDGFIIAYFWDFDGATTDRAVEDPGVITFNTPGTFDIVFTVTDDDGASGSDTVQLTVRLPQCSDGTDNDGDGNTDFPADSGCTSGNDDDETGGSSNQAPVAIIDTPATPITVFPGQDILFTGTGIDNDGTIVSYFWDFDGGTTNSNTEDPGVRTFSATGVFDVVFTVTDNDGATGSDTIRVTVVNAPQCNDTLDNDGDGRTDFPNDPGCTSTNDDSEVDPITLPECSDGIDNDADNLIDFPNDPGCVNAADNSEVNAPTTPQCNDGLDNDADGLIDFPLDSGCTSINDDNETNVNNNGPHVVITNPAADMFVPVGTTINFVGHASDTDGTITTVQWNFDGASANVNQTANTVSFVSNQSVTFNTVGDFDIQFTGFDNSGDFGIDAVMITVVNNPQCNDNIDNDGDGRVDFPADPGCDSTTDNNEVNTPKNTSTGKKNDNSKNSKELIFREVGFIEGDDYASKNCGADADVADDFPDLGLDSMDCVYILGAEKNVRLLLTLENPNKFEVTDVVLTADFLDMDVRRSVGPIRMSARKIITREIAIEIPHDIPSGEYDVRISAHNELTSRTIFRTIHIVRPLEQSTSSITQFEENYLPVTGLAVVKTTDTNANMAVGQNNACPEVLKTDGLLDAFAKILTCWINRIMSN